MDGVKKEETEVQEGKEKGEARGSEARRRRKSQIKRRRWNGRAEEEEWE